MLTFALLHDLSNLYIFKDLYGEYNDCLVTYKNVAIGIKMVLPYFSWVFFPSCVVHRYIFIGYRNNRYFPHTNSYKYANRSGLLTMQMSTYKELLIY